jgi:ankyrin repeat protein
MGLEALQTVAAVLDLLRVAYEATVFLKKVKDADKIAAEIGERIARLSSVLEGVQAVLKHRDDAETTTQGQDAEAVAVRIRASIASCADTLQELSSKIGGFKPRQESDSITLFERVRIAFRHPSVNRINGELEARIQTLATDLTVLQLYDQATTTSSIQANHEQVCDVLSKLDSQVTSGNQLLAKLMRVHRDFVALHERRTSSANDTSQQEVSEETIETLSACLREAGDLHERYTSEFLPDDRSIRIRGQIDTPLPSETPIGRRLSVVSPSLSAMAMLESVEVDFDCEDRYQSEEEDDVLPLQILNRYIIAYVEWASRERDAEHFHQAEVNLSQAIQYSRQRETRYGIAFANQDELEEEMAILYLKQKRWAEAVTKISSLLRERRPSAAGQELDSGEQAALARQNQLLASIYFDRHLCNVGAALSNTSEDVKKAEVHANRAFKILFGQGERRVEQADEYNTCIQLLVRILEATDKTVESNELKKFLVEGSSVASESIRANSTAQNGQAEEYSVIDKHDILVEAIRSGDSEQIQIILEAEDFDPERICKCQKTPLMHAVENADESTVHKLLGPQVSADINTVNKRKLTALHLSVAAGLHDMTRCLLHHDADVFARDRGHHTPMIKAILANDMIGIKLLFDRNEATSKVRCGDEWSALHFAVHQHSPEMTTLLLDLDPELGDATDQSGKTALHHCTDLGELEQVRALLEHRHRPNVNAIDRIGRTPLYFAASKPWSDLRASIVHLLVERGAHVDDSKPPLRARDYDALKPFLRRDSAVSRTSVSTSGTVGTTSTQESRFSKWSRRLGRG